MSTPRADVREHVPLGTVVHLVAKKCLRCAWVWVARVRDPKKCPACGSPDWGKPYKYRTYRGGEHQPRRRRGK